MLDFVMGFFREYWPLVVVCGIGHFGMPKLLDREMRRKLQRRQQHAAKH